LRKSLRVSELRISGFGAEGFRVYGFGVWGSQDVLRLLPNRDKITHDPHVVLV